MTVLEWFRTRESSGESESTRPESESESIRCESEFIGPESESESSRSESESNKSQCESGFDLESWVQQWKKCFILALLLIFLLNGLIYRLLVGNLNFLLFCTDIHRLTARNMYRLKPLYFVTGIKVYLYHYLYYFYKYNIIIIKFYIILK